MKKFTFFFLFTLFLQIQLQSQSISWAKQAGGEGSDQGYDISVDASGNVYVSGWFSGTAQFGTETLTSFGMQDIFIASYDSSGLFRWVKQAGSNGNEVCAGIITNTGGDSFITGWFSETSDFDNFSVTSAGSYDMFVAKYDASGAVKWVSRGGGPSDDYGNRITLANDGGVCIGGSFRETIWVGDHQLTSLGNRDILLSHFSADGEVVCAKSAGGTGEDRAYGIFQDGDGNYFLTGFFSGTAGFDEIELTSPAIISTYIAKMTNQGFFQWVNMGGGAANDFARGFDIEADGEGNVFSTGFFSGSITFGNQTLSATGGQYDFDAFLTKTNPQGELIWAKKAGSNGIDQGTTLFVNPTGEIFLGGFFTQTCYFGDLSAESSGKSDVFATKYGADGTAEWVISAGGSENEYAYGVVNDASGSLYLTGVFGGTAGFGNTNLQSAGGNDIFVAKIPSTSSGLNFPSGDGRQIRIIPNPAKDFLQIGFNGIGENPGILNLEILNMEGRKVLSEINISPDQKIDISSLNPGTYLIRITRAGFAFTEKFIVE
jgi:hypothetical protein